MATIPEARFSTNFLDEDFTTDTAPPAGSNGGDGGTQQASSVPSPKSTNPFSTEDTEGNVSGSILTSSRVSQTTLHVLEAMLSHSVCNVQLASSAFSELTRLF